jgi:hypothetical protein
LDKRESKGKGGGAIEVKNGRRGVESAGDDSKMKAKADEAKYMISENQKFNRACDPNQWFVGQCH